jgi:hypothetical protein
MERVRIKSDQFWTKDSSGNKLFDSSYSYLVTNPGGALKAGGIQEAPVALLSAGTAYQQSKGFPFSGTTTTTKATAVLPRTDHINALYWVSPVIGAGPPVDAYIPNTPLKYYINGVEAGDVTVALLIIMIQGGGYGYEAGWHYSIPTGSNTSPLLADSDYNTLTFDFLTGSISLTSTDSGNVISVEASSVGSPTLLAHTANDRWCSMSPTPLSLSVV